MLPPDAPALAALPEAARAILPDVVRLRRALHRRPEVGLELPETQAFLAAELERLGLRPATGRTLASLVAIIEGAAPGPTVLLRADMDGLPLTEATGLDFTSAIEGRMHACGHDTHMAMLLGAARLLVERRAALDGRVVLMFQPGEEGYGGARLMLEEGVLAAGGEPPVRAYALHITTTYASGTIATRAGALLAASDVLRIRVEGRGGHASAPYLALDPVTVAAEIVLALQVMVTRRVDVFDPAVITIAHVTAGTTNNVIPATAELEGTIRTVSEEARTALLVEIERVAAGVAAAHGATVKVEIVPGYPVTMNDPEAATTMLETAAGLAAAPAGTGTAEPDHRMAAPIMGAEDFSYVLARVPGAMAFLGARPPGDDPATTPGNHSDRVVFDEAAMAVGAALSAALALRHLGRDGSSSAV